MLSQAEERNASALLYHLESESNSGQKKRRMTRTLVVVMVMALALAALVASSVVGAEPKRGLDVSMKLAAQDNKQGSLSIKENYVKNPSPPPCAKGHYRAAGGTQCYACPKGYKCEKNQKIRCEAGVYQDMVGQTKCKNPGCGCYVPTAGSTRKYACRTGFYQPRSYGKATECLAASKGYFVSETSRKCEQKKCPEGTYQDCKGQGSCMKTPCGHKAPGTGNKKPKKCPGGEYQDAEGQGTCKKARAGHYALAGACHDTECKPGEYQVKPGQEKCEDAKCGTYVANLKQIGYKPCGKRTYQPQTGARSCLPIPKGAVATKNRCGYKECKKGTFQAKTPKGFYFCKPARCGYYVDEDGQDEEKACPVGTYQPKPGQSKCLDVDVGYKPVLGRCTVVKCPPGTYKPGKGRYGGDRCTPCPPGKFQKLAGQPKCLPAPCGSYVKNSKQTSATSCPPGTYQKRVGQKSCLKARQGKYAPGGGCKELDCPVGTYTYAEGQAKCKDADCGHFVDMPGSSVQKRCGFGTYQPLTGQARCLLAPKGSIPGENRKGEARCAVKECEVGTYQDDEGQESCKKAKCGYYVAQKGYKKQFKCPKGRYSLGRGNKKCKVAPKGKFVADGCKVEECPDGTYSDSEGQTQCYPVPCGYEPKPDKTGIEKCPPGKYQDKKGGYKSLYCKPARKGHYADGLANCSDEPCKRGTYQPHPGQTSCKPAKCGHYVSAEGSASQKKCRAGSYQPSTRSVGCLTSTLQLTPQEGMCHPLKVVKCTLTSATDVSGTELEKGTVTSGEACQDRCKKNTKCHCFRFVMSKYSYNGQCTLMKDCKDLTSYVLKGVQTGKCSRSSTYYGL